MKETPLGTNPPPIFEDGPGKGVEPVGGKFQPPFAIAYPGGGDHLIFVLGCHSAGLALLWYSDSDFVTVHGVAKSNALQTT